MPLWFQFCFYLVSIPMSLFYCNRVCSISFPGSTPRCSFEWSPWQELIERSLTLSWWRHAPGVSPKWPTSQAGHLGWPGWAPGMTSKLFERTRKLIMKRTHCYQLTWKYTVNIDYVVLFIHLTHSFINLKYPRVSSIYKEYLQFAEALKGVMWRGAIHALAALDLNHSCTRSDSGKTCFESCV